MSRWRLLLKIASYVVVFGLGFAVTRFYGPWWRFASSFASVAKSRESAGFRLEALLSKPGRQKEAALLDYLVLLDHSGEEGKQEFSTLLAADKAISLARLSILAQGRGDAAQGQAYIEWAQSYCPKVKWQDCNPGKLLKYATWMNGQFGH